MTSDFLCPICLGVFPNARVAKAFIAYIDKIDDGVTIKGDAQNTEQKIEEMNSLIIKKYFYIKNVEIKKHMKSQDEIDAIVADAIMYTKGLWTDFFSKFTLD